MFTFERKAFLWRTGLGKLALHSNIASSRFNPVFRFFLAGSAASCSGAEFTLTLMVAFVMNVAENGGGPRRKVASA